MIEWNWPTQGIVNLATAIVLALFALGVGWLARFKGAAKDYALFGVGFGLTAAFANISQSSLALNVEDPSPEAVLVFATTGVLAALAAIPWIQGTRGLIAAYGGGRDAWMGWVGAAIAAASYTPVAVDFYSVSDHGALITTFRNVPFYALFISLGWMAAAPLMLARARRRQPMPGQAILAAALAAYPVAWPLAGAVAAGVGTGLPFAGGGALWWAVPAIGCYLTVIVAWARPMPDGSRAGLAVIATAGVFLCLATLFALYAPRLAPAGFARTFEVVLVAYAILRLQYLGIDAKVRFGISKTTVAAVFLAVIFLVSEGAQVVFGEGNEWLGLAAGGALVFALAPLSRFADRVAEAAVPSGEGQPTLLSQAEEVYAAAVRRYLRDGTIDADEEVQLADIAEHMGIGAGRAVRIRQEVEAG